MVLKGQRLNRFTQAELKCMEHALVWLDPLAYQKVRDTALAKTRLRLKTETNRAR